MAKIESPAEIAKALRTFELSHGVTFGIREFPTNLRAGKVVSFAASTGLGPLGENRMRDLLPKLEVLLKTPEVSKKLRVLDGACRPEIKRFATRILSRRLGGGTFHHVAIVGVDPKVLKIIASALGIRRKKNHFDNAQPP